VHFNRLTHLSDRKLTLPNLIKMLRIIKLSSRRFSSGIGGAFGKKGSAAEGNPFVNCIEKFIHDHEVEVLKEYRKTHPEAKQVPQEKLAQVVAKVKAEKLAKPFDFGSSPGTVSGGSMGGAGAIGKKGAAQEEQWIRKHDQELIEKLKKDEKAKK
jgi:Mitochondrial ATPase inhibitor, IATP